MLGHLHHKILTGTVMNPLWQTYGVKPLAYEFLFTKIAPIIYEQLADDMGVTPQEWMRLISLQPQTGDPIIRVQNEMKAKISDTLMGEVADAIKDGQAQNLKHYYGVLDGSGLEFFCPAGYWESDDMQIRTGGHKFWLNWCKRGGRNGSSQPFSVYMTEKDAEWVTGKNQENPIAEFVRERRIWFGNHGINVEDLTTEFIYYLRNKGSAYGRPYMQFLWPWEQHLDVIGEQTQAEMLESGMSEDDEDYISTTNEKFRENLMRYFSSRQKCDGCLPVEFDFV
jgi:hypothetical protein